MWWIVGAALAGQLAFEAEREGSSYDYLIAWKAAGTRQEAQFTLPAEAVSADRDVPRKPDLQALAQAQAKALRNWGRTLKGPDLDVRLDGRTVSWSASGTNPDAVKRAMRDAEAVVEAEKETWMVANHVIAVDRDALSYDHATLAAAYADDLRPLADALSPATDARGYAADALTFVQSIPYETRGDGGDLGFRRPLALLDRNRGDCDSKATLFLALMRARFPEVGSAIVYVPNHALVALALPPEKGDATLKVDGVKWVLAEPVGPRETPIGLAPDGHAGQAKRGVIRVLTP